MYIYYIWLPKRCLIFRTYLVTQILGDFGVGLGDSGGLYFIYSLHIPSCQKPSYLDIDFKVWGLRGGGLCYIFSCKHPSIINHHIDQIFDRVSSLTQSAWNQSDIDCISQRQTLPLLLTFFGPLLRYKARSRLARASLAEWDTLWSGN